MAASGQSLGEGTVTFARPDLLWMSAVLPTALGLALWAYVRRCRRVARVLGEGPLVARLGGAQLQRPPRQRIVLPVLAALLLGFAASGPRWGIRIATDTARSLNLVLAVDVSKSMEATDVLPDRLRNERLLARQLIRELRGDRIGMVAFAGRAYILSPLTVDHSALQLYIDALDPSVVSQGGSSLSAAITRATDLVREVGEDTGGDRVVVLMTDGEALEDFAAVHEAADRARRAGVRVITVGIGTARGASVPEHDPILSRVSAVKLDENGRVVISRLNEELLRSVASRTGGQYIRLTDPGAPNRLLGALQGLDRETGTTTGRPEPRPRYALFAALALMLLAVEAHLSRRPRRPVGPSYASAGTVMRSAGSLGRRALPLLLLLALVGYGIGDLERGNRLYRAGRYAEAVAAYEAALRGGNASSELQYNLGTALLRLGRYDEAESHLREALSSVAPDLRQRTYYNLGNRFLSAARSSRDPRQQSSLLENALEAYKRALRLRPGDQDAKWNLELAQREQDRQASLGGGQSPQQQQPQQQPQSQGAGSAQNQPRTGEGEDRNAQALNRPMTRDQADRILSAVEQDERQLTREKLRKGQRRTAVARDW